MNNTIINVQQCSNKEFVADNKLLQQWAEVTCNNINNQNSKIKVQHQPDHNKHNSLTIRIVDPDEITNLNYQYRGKNTATNVLAFPFVMPDIIIDEKILGDVILCAKIINQQVQNKPLLEHWAHITIHGVLHLLGFDHQTAQDAEIMQNKEIEILAKFNQPNPYL